MRRVIRQAVVVMSSVAAVALLQVWVSGQRAGRTQHTGFEGIWNSATATPLERPRQFGDKPFFTPDEAADWERQVAQNNEERPPQPGAKNTGTYNTVYREFGSRTVTTLCLDPPESVRRCAYDRFICMAMLGCRG